MRKSLSYKFENVYILDIYTGQLKEYIDMNTSLLVMPEIVINTVHLNVMWYFLIQKSILLEILDKLLPTYPIPKMNKL